MDYRAVLRHQPWLEFANKHNISFRFLEYTNGDMFIAYNTITDNYEIHSRRTILRQCVPEHRLQEQGQGSQRLNGAHCGPSQQFE